MRNCTSVPSIATLVAKIFWEQWFFVDM